MMKKCWVKDERRTGAAGSVPEGPLSRPRKRELSGLESAERRRIPDSRWGDEGGTESSKNTLQVYKQKSVQIPLSEARCREPGAN